MNRRKYLTISLAFTALALGLTATPALAKPGLQGSFELPSATYFGNTLLQSGHYNIRISTEMADLAHVLAIYVSGEGVTKTFLAISTPKPESGRNYLEIAGIDGTSVVRAFNIGTLGRSFSLGATKNVRKKALRAYTGPAIAVPVSLGAD